MEELALDHKADRFLDCSSLSCLVSIAKTKRALNEMDGGQTLEMLATDPEVMPDMEALAQQTEHELLLSEQQDEGTFRLIKKKR